MEGIAFASSSQGKRQQSWRRQNTAEYASVRPPSPTATPGGGQPETVGGPPPSASQLVGESVPTTSQAEIEPTPAPVERTSAKIARWLAHKANSDDILGAACPHLCATDSRFVRHMLAATTEQETEGQMNSVHGTERRIPVHLLATDNDCLIISALLVRLRHKAW